MVARRGTGRTSAHPQEHLTIDMGSDVDRGRRTRPPAIPALEIPAWTIAGTHLPATNPSGIPPDYVARRLT